jgi:hypothetical protein
MAVLSFSLEAFLKKKISILHEKTKKLKEKMARLHTQHTQPLQHSSCVGPHQMNTEMLACNLSIYVYTFPYNWFVPLKKKNTTATVWWWCWCCGCSFIFRHIARKEKKDPLLSKEGAPKSHHLV